MADRRRRSPESSSGRRRDYKRQDYHEIPRMRSGAESLSSSSSSSSYIDISRTFPNRSGLRAFFTAPSERRRLRKRRSSRLLQHNNSSSSSVNSDLAYGTGFIKRPKGRGIRSRKGKDIDREKHREYYRERETYNGLRENDRSGIRDGISRATTDAEILAVGAGLAKLARDQNKLDLKGARNGKRSAEIYSSNQPSGYNNGTARGLGPSKVSHGSDTVDEDGWESASDAGSESSVDSKLAFGGDGTGGWFGWGKTNYKPQSRKSTIVDPRLFGPENSLNGVLTQPVGFGDVPWSSSSDFGQRGWAPAGPVPIASAGGSQTSLQHVYPIPTSDPSRFEATRSSVVSGAEPYISSRPAPIPLQQPQPIAPVSQSVFEPTYATRRESTNVKSPSISTRGQSLAEAALVGVAGAAVGAAIASDRRDDRKDKYRQDPDFRDYDRSSKRREKRDSPDREERREKRRDKEKSRDSADDQRREKKRDKRREEGRGDGRDERREKRREERRSERSDDRYETRRTKSEASVSTTSVDPFQYQVADDAFATPVISSPIQGSIVSAPTVVTVEREPDFSRMRSSSIKDQTVTSRSGSRREFQIEDDGEQRRRRRDSRDRTLYNAEAIYQETEHSTAPIEVAAIGAAVAAVTAESYRESRSDRRRDERRSERREREDYDSSSRKTDSTRESKRDREPERDPIQEEADRAYREIVMARKIASQVIRSRTPSPDRSVVDKYDHDNEEEKEIIRIVTPPGMEEHKKEGPYDAPNADFKLDLVLEDPRELQNFGVPSINMEGRKGGSLYFKHDPDASAPRPHLNLVRPTPTPSPMPEKQADRSEQSQPAKPMSKDAPNVVASPTSSTVSKGVTWGENETKHYEVESPQDHRDEYVSSAEVQAREMEIGRTEAKSADKAKSSNDNKRGGWGAIAAGIIGTGVVAAASSTKTATSKENKSPRDKEHKDEPYEYRGVVVEPESPPSTGPKPTVTQPAHIPGAFGDDLDFTATVAAGLQDTGFDPNIVINDPSFRRRESPPGSDQPRFYRSPFAETVSDLGTAPLPSDSKTGSRGFIMGEVPETPKDWQSVSPNNDEFSFKLSKKEQKKRDKAARKQSGEEIPIEEETKTGNDTEEPNSYFETPKLSKKEQKKRDRAAQKYETSSEGMTPIAEPSVAAEIVEEPESYFETPKKSKKKSKRISSSYNEGTNDDLPDDRRVSVPVDAFDDLRNAEDEWNETKKSKKGSKRESEHFDSPQRAATSDSIIELARSSSKKSKDKSRRKSGQYETETDPTEVSLPPSTPSENSRDGELEDGRKSRKSSKRDSADRDDSRSVVSADASRYDDDDNRKSKKKSRSSTKDDFDDTRSVASAPAGDDYEDPKKKKKDKEKRNSGSFFGLFGSKSDSGVRDDSPKGSKEDGEDSRKTSKKSKRNSVPDGLGLYGDIGSQSISDLTHVSSGANGQSNGSRIGNNTNVGSHGDDEHEKKPSSKEDSFLAKAGTLGAGVGLAGAAVAIAAQQYQQSKADNAGSSRPTEQTSGEVPVISKQQHYETIDPEITQRQIRPSIDPQYGDFLPLPPSDPASPITESNDDDLPGLPESRPDTPEADRLSRDKTLGSIRKNVQETPMKSPSQSAVPLKFIMGNRSTPSSPGLARSSPMQSPATPKDDSLAFPRSRPRPTSWDSTKEYKPLYLVETNRRGSAARKPETEEVLPTLPPSQSTSRSSSQVDFTEHALGHDLEQVISEPDFAAPEPLSINTNVESAPTSQDLLDSQQSTPKADVKLSVRESLISSPNHGNLKTLPATTENRSPSPKIENGAILQDTHLTSLPASKEVGLVSSIGYFASSHRPQNTNESWLDELPSRSPNIQRQPSPVEPMSKNRSSYLLQSSPMSRQTEDDPTDHNADSPTTRQLYNYSDGDIMPNIEETQGIESFSDARKPSPRFEPELPAPLGTDLANDGTSNADVSNEFLETLPKDLSLTEEPLAAEQALTAEESRVTDGLEIYPEAKYEAVQFGQDGFVVKPKKGKKKDKKKGKDLLENFAIDEHVPPEINSKDAQEIPVSRDTSHVEDSPQGDPDNDIKGTHRSLPPLQDHISVLDASHHRIEEGVAGLAIAPTDLSTKSKKDKKKDKKKAKSVMAWEEEHNHSSLPLDQEASIHINEASSQAPLPEDDFWSTETNKSKKKKDKKRSKTTVDPIAEYQDNIDLLERSKDNPSETPPSQISTILPDGLGEGLQSHDTAHPEDAPHEGTGEVDLVSQEANDMDHSLSEIARGVNDDNPSIDLSEMAVAKDDKVEILAAGDEHTDQLAPQVIIQDVPKDTSASIDDTVVDTKMSKKKKKKGKSGLSWEPEAVDNPVMIAQPSVSDNIDDFETPSSKKSKKSKKAETWTSEENRPSPTDLATPAVESQFSGEMFDSQIEQAPVDVKPESFPLYSSKKKKKGKKVDKWTSEDLTPEEPAVSREVLDSYAERIPVETEPEPFIPALSKKKNKGKKAEICTPGEPTPNSSSDTTKLADEAELSHELLDSKDKQEPDIIEFDSFAKSSSNKKNKKSRKSQAWNFEPDHPQPQPNEPDPDLETSVTLSIPDEKFDNFGVLPVNSGKELQSLVSSVDNISQTSRGEVIDQRTAQTSTPEEEVSTPKPTPVDGPGAWPATPFTPSTRNGEEADEPPSKEYFPSTASLHSPQTPQNSEDSAKRGYFPSARALLPFTAPTSAIFKTKDDGAPPLGLQTKADVDQISERKAVGESQETQHIQPSRDGLNAGYDEQQLSLARRLQEEFSSGSKKLKKDKKKRQSLPSTPGSDTPRSRRVMDDTDHPRARSLSIGAEASVEQSDTVSSGGQRAAIYSEDQLELARQLKMEFESGIKKSKKDKKKRPGPLSRSSTQDTLPDQSNADQLTLALASDIDPSVGSQLAETPPRVDGFASGYKEDQLSLARQLQAEFGSGAKKSKKDKKRGSTSQTPLQEANARDDYSEETLSSSNVPQTSNIAQAASQDTISKTLARDGRTLVYSEEQLELAKQLKNEFGSGSKKSKKDKKRQNVSRGFPDDDIATESLQKELTLPFDIQGVESESPEPNAPEHVNDKFTTIEKKSKNDSKAKKQDSIPPAFNETSRFIDVSSAPTTVEHELANPDATQAKDHVGGLEDITVHTPGDLSLIAATELDVAKSDENNNNNSSNDFEKQVEALHNAQFAETTGLDKQPHDASLPKHEDDSISRKLSKKEKKKRQISTPVDPSDTHALETTVEGSEASAEPTRPDFVAEQPADLVENSQDDFGFSLKKSKKDKKKQKSRSGSTFEASLSEPPPPEISSSFAVPLDKFDDLPTAVTSSLDPQAIKPAAISKKAKKDKKVRQSMQDPDYESTVLDTEKPFIPRLNDDQLHNDGQGSHLQTLKPTVQESLPLLDPPVEDSLDTAKETTDELFGDYSFPTKKSKRDKKKNKPHLVDELEGSLSSSVDPIPKSADVKTQPMDANLEETAEFLPGTVSPNIADRISDEAIVEPEDEWGTFSVKKSKKDKKKRKSGLSMPVESTATMNELSAMDNSQASMVPDLPESQAANILGASESSNAETFETVISLSKKEKKKRKSGLSAPVGQSLPFDIAVAPLKKEQLQDSETSLLPGDSDAPKIHDLLQAADPLVDTLHVDSNANDGEIISAQPIPSEPIFLVDEPIHQERQSSPVMFSTPAVQKTDLSKPKEVSSAELGRNLSKKDKRKRQSTAEATSQVDDILKTPLVTSWADEVEEAENEMSLPTIEDISKNESIAHASSTIEADPASDFVKSNKKGKRGKKSDPRLLESSSKDDSFHPPIGEDAHKATSEEKNTSSIPSLATGVLIGAALGSDELLITADEKRPLPPLRKLSKKEKRKQSIDRRSTTKDDIFDDPSLWEGDKPRAFEETGGADDSAGSDGFWSSPPDEQHTTVGNQARPADSLPGLDERVIESESVDIDHPAPVPTSAAEDVHRNDSVVGPIISEPTMSMHREVFENNSIKARDTSRAIDQWNDLPSKSLFESSKKDNKLKDLGQIAARDSSQEQNPHTDSEPSMVRVASISEPHLSHQQSLENERAPEEHSQNLSNTTVKAPNEQRQEVSAPSSEVASPMELAYSRSGHPGASMLPVVREESPIPTEIDLITPRHSFPHSIDEPNRDSAFVTDSPIPRQKGFTDDHEHVRDSGVHLRDFSPAPISATDDAIANMSWPAVDEESETVDLKFQQPRVEKSTKHRGDVDRSPQSSSMEHVKAVPHKTESVNHKVSEEQKIESHDIQQHYDGKPKEERRFKGSTGQSDVKVSSRDLLPSQRRKEEVPIDLHRTQTIRRSRSPKEIGSVKQRVERFESQSPDSTHFQKPKADKYPELNASQRPKAERLASFNESSIPDGATLAGSTIGFAAARQASKEQRPESVASNRSPSNINRLRTPDPKFRSDSASSHRSLNGTPPLRRSDRKSGDLRSLSQQSKSDLAKEAELAGIATATAAAATLITANPQANEGRVRAKDMADVYDGFGEGRMGSPRSPTRPHSMRRRQSMQVLDLEQRLEQMAAENRMLSDAKAQAERTLQTTQHDSSAVVERDAEIESLKRTLDWLQNEVTRLTEVNDGLTSANITLGSQQNDRYGVLESEHAQTTVELQEMRDSHNNLSAGMEGIVQNEIRNAVQDKDQEIAQLRADLESAKEQIREMQRQILESKANSIEFLTIRDEDYFDTACQQLCQHVQQWVLRFSKFSDMRACRLTSEINNDKIIDRLDNAILDGSDVDSYLADRVKRRDVFMSMTMTMVWEFVFTRYLFGMDREQRQKLKSLEKLLSEVGPAAAVHQWRATTLTLLSKREPFVQQREQDTLAVVNAILETLTEILPPPSHLEDQIQEQLVRVMKAAVELSIEMRTQRAEYMMLPPLQPEYDANGDLASKVSFNAALMNERSGDTVSNEELEEAGAVVRIVLFPLVVKKGDDRGEGDEEIVVCPAQVLVAKPKKTVRVFSPGSVANQSRVSMQSSMPADYGDISGI